MTKNVYTTEDGVWRGKKRQEGEKQSSNWNIAASLLYSSSSFLSLSLCVRISFYTRVFCCLLLRVFGTIKRQLRERAETKRREADDYNNESRSVVIRFGNPPLCPPVESNYCGLSIIFFSSSSSCCLSFLTRNCLSLLFLISSSIFSCSSLWRYRGQRV